MIFGRQFLCRGISDARVDAEAYDLGHGQRCSGLFVHLFSPNMVAFARSGSEGDRLDVLEKYTYSLMLAGRPAAFYGGCRLPAR